mmetsp:Transcript_20662/g.34556  ORF Transcript_20662/g.34556 Transcript_20662/m.34556 type:complete len:277 (+) Transcript_20662:558-1388(+)
MVLCKGIRVFRGGAVELDVRRQALRLEQVVLGPTVLESLHVSLASGIFIAVALAEHVSQRLHLLGAVASISALADTVPLGHVSGNLLIIFDNVVVVGRDVGLDELCLVAFLNCFVTRPGALCHLVCQMAEEVGGPLERQHDEHAQQVEAVVHGGTREPASQLVRVRKVAHRHQRVGHRRADVGAHHHRDGGGHIHLIGPNQRDDDGRGRGGGLDQHRGQDADHHARDRVIHHVEHLGGVFAAEKLEAGAHEPEAHQEDPDEDPDHEEYHNLQPVDA